MNEEDYPDYSLIDQNGGVYPHDHAAHLTDTETTGSKAIEDAGGADGDESRVVVPEDDMGYGFCDRRLCQLGAGIDLDRMTYYTASPRAYDKKPADIPATHPLRAIAKVLEVAPRNSTIRIKAFVLTDWLVIDLFLHYGSTHDVKIILHHVDPKEDDDSDPKKKNTVKSIKSMLKYYQRYQSYLLFDNIEIRVADVMGGHCCKHGNTLMHEKVILTDAHAVYGSYNFTGAARCKHWESIRISKSLDEEKESFDTHWNALGTGREFTQYYPDRLPDSCKRQRTT